MKTYKIARRRAGLLGAFVGLVKRDIKIIRALDGISLDVGRGELLGYIGPNGAGKSTTVKILAGILVPDSGIVEVAGRVPWKDRIRHVRRIGVVFGQRTQLWWDLPVVESFDLLCDIYRIPKSSYQNNRDELVEGLGISDILDTPVRQLSLGQRMRCDLAAALLHEPELLFLDEPTIGLDAIAKLAFRDFIQKWNHQRRTTVILTTHDMDDIEALCTRLVVIGDGRIFYDGDLASLRSMLTGERRLIVDVQSEEKTISDPDATVVKQEGHRFHLAFDSREVKTADLVKRIMAKHAVRDLFVENPPIEEIIAQLYTEKLRT